MKKWLLHPAEWWEFWYPQSGHIGGGLIGSAMIVLLAIWIALR